jgi:hypothetical protein
MKCIFILPLFLFTNFAVLAQKSTEILPNSITLPRLSTTEQNTVPPQQAGNIIYNADEKKLALHDGTNWNYLTSNTSGFRRIKIFNFNEAWSVPADVTKIRAELWGGGTAGTKINSVGATIDCKGGIGSCYTLYELDVVPNEFLFITVGAGGSSNDYYNAPSSMIQRDNTTLALANINSYYSNGISGLLKLVEGELGHTGDFSFQQVDTGVFRKIVRTGAGGGTYPYFNNGGRSSTLEFSVPAGTLIGGNGGYYSTGSYGGGGACANTTITYGARGRVIIYY